MKLEQIEERITLFPEYLKTAIDNTTYGTEITWWDMIKPALRQPVQTFDQWLYSHRHYDLVDYDNWEPYTTFGNIQMISTLGEPDRLSGQDMWNMWNNTGWMIIDSQQADRELFKPLYGVAVDPYGGYNEHPSEVYRIKERDNKRVVEYRGRSRSQEAFYKEAFDTSKFYGTHLIP